MAKVETIKIEADNEQGFIIINESDFKEGEHARYEEKKEVQEKVARKKVVRKKAAK
jgi:hypothetical protein